MRRTQEDGRRRPCCWPGAGTASAPAGSAVAAAARSRKYPRGVPKVAVVHHLPRPFLGHAAALREAGLELDERHAVNGDPLPDPRRVDGLVVLGGLMSVADGADPLPEEVELLRGATNG